MTSSLRNSIHRRNHKERSQLAHRRRLGILEKHKDYVKRARDYHSKQDRLTVLWRKAAQRNKDEFYFSMNREKTQGGVHVKDRGNVALPVDIVKVLKTQDENYVRTMRAAGLKKIDKIKNRLTALADLVRPGSGSGSELDEEDLKTLKEAGIVSAKSKGKQRGKHIIFVDNEEQARQYSQASTAKQDEVMDIISEPNQTEADLGWKSSSNPSKSNKRKHSKSSASVQDTEDSEHSEKPSTSDRRRLLKELAARLRRDKLLRYTEREFEMQRLLMGKGARRKIQGVQKIGGNDGSDEDEKDDPRSRRRTRVIDEKAYKPRVYKWRLERKR